MASGAFDFGATPTNTNTNSTSNFQPSGFGNRGPPLFTISPRPRPASTNFLMPTKESPAAEAQVQVQRQVKKQGKDLKATQHELFNKEKYSDLTVKCKSREWKCHRAILCPRCPFFEAACGGQFTEASTREIDLSSDDESALGIMLQYLYTYDVFNHGLATATSYQLIIIGDKYELEEIRDVGMKNLTNEIADLTSSNGLWAAEWYPQICQLQQKGTDALKMQLADVIAKHAREMIKNEAVRELVATDGALAVLLVEKLANPGGGMFGTSKEVKATEWFTGPRFASASQIAGASSGVSATLLTSL